MQGLDQHFSTLPSVLRFNAKIEKSGFEKWSFPTTQTKNLNQNLPSLGNTLHSDICSNEINNSVLL